MSVPVLTPVWVPPVVSSFQEIGSAEDPAGNIATAEEEMVFCSRELVQVVSCLVTEGVRVVPVALG